MLIYEPRHCQYVTVLCLLGDNTTLNINVRNKNDTQLVGDSLRFEPVQLSVQEPRQATVKLGCTADNSSCGIQHSLQRVCR